MNCPSCHSTFYIKNGIVKSLQRFKCKSCGYNYTVEKKSSSIEACKKRIAIILYLEGMKVTTIAQKLDVSHVSVIKWIKKYGNNLVQLRAQINEYDNKLDNSSDSEQLSNLMNQ
jgi:transposase-like protein